jgi:hypothetical protein
MEPVKEFRGILADQAAISIQRKFAIGNGNDAARGDGALLFVACPK